jgi:hypothetical protein
VRLGVEVLAGEEDDLALEPHLADGGHGGVVEVAQVDTADLGADGARQQPDVEVDPLEWRPGVR